MVYPVVDDDECFGTETFDDDYEEFVVPHQIPPPLPPPPAATYYHRQQQPQPEPSRVSAATAAASQQQQQQLKTVRIIIPGACIEDIRPVDVLCGRDKICHSHPGNKRFRQLILFYREQYQKAPHRDDKTRLTNHIIHIVGSYGGRFLKQQQKHNEEAIAGRTCCCWHMVPYSFAHEKVSHALRSAKDPNLQRRFSFSKNGGKRGGRRNVIIKPPTKEEDLAFQQLAEEQQKLFFAAASSSTTPASSSSSS